MEGWKSGRVEGWKSGRVEGWKERGGIRGLSEPQMTRISRISRIRGRSGIGIPESTV